jgi:hypothetical protein
MAAEPLDFDRLRAALHIMDALDALRAAYVQLKSIQAAPMAKTYTPEELAAFAKHTAEQAKGVAIRWWVDKHDPTTLQVTTEVTLGSSGRVLTLQLQAYLPEWSQRPPSFFS